MNEAYPEDEGDPDQWSNTIGEDAELEQLWSALIAAVADATPQELETRIATHFATLGARSRRTTEGLILAVIAATAGEGARWEDWRVILHRHFARDERMDLAVASAILLEWRKEAIAPDWSSEPERVMERVIQSYAQDMQAAIGLLDKPGDAAAAAADLVTLASQLFDVAIALEPLQQEEVQHSLDVATILAGLGRQLGDRAENQPRPVALDVQKAEALLEVTMRQLEIGGPVVH